MPPNFLMESVERPVVLLAIAYFTGRVASCNRRYFSDATWKLM